MPISETAAWKALHAHAAETGKRHLRDFFDDPDDRFAEFSLRSEMLLLDCSKQRISRTTLRLLCDLARECELEDWIERLFCGDAINSSENRAALHTALRRPAGKDLFIDGENIGQAVQQNLTGMEEIVSRLYAGQWTGHSGKTVDTIVSIGVGGSDLGPYMTSEALFDSHSDPFRRLQLHFVSTMDGTQLASKLETFDPATTLFILSSKSFTTIDTLSNANTALQWMRRTSGADDAAIFRHHFIGVSVSTDKMTAWGIPAENQLLLWDWVGGRYSMWSAIGLPIALAIGMDGFRQLLAGANAMDDHFRNTPLERNLPVMLALVGIWNINFLDIRSHAILPYDGRLALLPGYLQQLEMESNGKRVCRDGQAAAHRTCPIIWGEVGPNAQHAFYQLLHQGTEAVMCDFIVAARRYHDHDNPDLYQQHQLTLANCLAQSRILALGDEGIDADDAMAAFKRYPGNQPSTTILLDELTAYSLGQLIAVYEHKVFVQSVIWNINPFDQWGVELGKRAATELIEPLAQGRETTAYDSSTSGLLQTILACRKS